MTEAKRRKLEAAGWKVGTVQEFLGLSNAEMTLIEVKLALARQLREWRQRAGLSQAVVARRLRTSQPRLARMEHGEPGVTIDLLVRALCELGVKARRMGEVIGSVKIPKRKRATG